MRFETAATETEQDISSVLSARVRVLLADDHALLREGLRGLLDGQPDFEASNGVEAVEQAGWIMPDLVLMDVDMPVMDGLAATERIKATLPYVTIVMLTVHDTDDKLFAAICAGAQGYLLKDIHGAELVEALRGLARGEAPISRRARRKSCRWSPPASETRRSRTRSSSASSR